MSYAEISSFGNCVSENSGSLPVWGIPVKFLQKYWAKSPACWDTRATALQERKGGNRCPWAFPTGSLTEHFAHFRNGHFLPPSLSCSSFLTFKLQTCSHHDQRSSNSLYTTSWSYQTACPLSFCSNFLRQWSPVRVFLSCSRDGCFGLFLLGFNPVLRRQRQR